MFRRIQALWRLKLLLTALIGLVFWTGYSLLARHAWFPLRMPPLTWLDVAIPYQTEPWAWIYLSQFAVAGLLPWLIETRNVLRRYTAGLAIMNGVSFAVFFFFPVASPRVVDERGSDAMNLILTYDGTMNAFPSLHAGFVVYLALLTWRMFRGVLPRWWVVAGITWGLAILYATIAIRQHYVIDLVAGAALGVLADRLAWRRTPGVRAATTISRSSGVAFQDGCK